MSAPALTALMHALYDLNTFAIAHGEHGGASLAKGLGFDFVGENRMTYEQASEMIYRRLLRALEIRSGTLIDIMFATLPIVVVVTDSQVNRIKTGH